MFKNTTIKEARKKAKEILKKDPTNYIIRSCWECNNAHEHLKDAELLNCLWCGNWYYKGIKITE